MVFEKLVIAFQHETPKAPLSFMRGEWRFEETADGGTLITVAHRFDLVDGLDHWAACWLYDAETVAEEGATA